MVTMRQPGDDPTISIAISDTIRSALHSAMRISRIIDFISDFIKGLQYNYTPDDDLQTTFHVKFVIDTIGRLVNPEIEGKTHDELTPLDSACINSLSTLQNWSYGKNEGVPVNVLC